MRIYPRFRAFWPFHCWKKSALFCAFTVLNRAVWGEFFEVFFSRSLSTRDGFLTIPNEGFAGFTPCTCVFARIFVSFDPFLAGRKVPFFVPLQCSLSLWRGLYIKAMLGVNFSKFFPRFFCSQDGFLTLREGEAAPSNSGTCILTLVFTYFDPFIAGRKMPFFVP